MTARTTTDHVVLADDEPVALQPAIYTGTLEGVGVHVELLLTIYDDGTAEAAVRPYGSDPWQMWSPPIRLRRESLPVAATRTALCPCGQPGCSDAGVRA